MIQMNRLRPDSHDVSDFIMRNRFNHRNEGRSAAAIIPANFLPVIYR